MKEILLLLIILSNSLLKSEEIQRQQIIMNTFTSITLEKKHRQEIQKGFKLLKSIEKSLSSYDKHALLYQLNQDKKVKANAYLLEAIKKSQDFYKLSNGYFNITIGSITKELYHFGEEESIPSKKELLRAGTNIDSIHIKENILTLDKNTTLDLGGMGKGYGVEKVANYYRKQNISHGIIAISGDIQALHPTSIFIDSPFNHKPFIKLQTLNQNTSVSTSGTYRRYVKTKEHHHLIDPKTKKQAKSFVSITLVTLQNNTLIDAMATAIGVMPEEEALYFLINNPHIGYVLVRANGNVIYGNLKKLCKITWLSY
jgi:thiamine biosynthesis lipoprotein